MTFYLNGLRFFVSLRFPKLIPVHKFYEVSTLQVQPNVQSLVKFQHIAILYIGLILTSSEPNLQ